MKEVIGTFVLSVCAIIIFSLSLGTVLAQTQWHHVTSEPVLEIGAASEWDRTGKERCLMPYTTFDNNSITTCNDQKIEGDVRIQNDIFVEKKII